MIFRLERMSWPAFEPVTLEEMKRHLRLTSLGSPPSHPDDEDITGLITAGREWVEQETGRALIDQQWHLTILCNVSTIPANTDAVSGVVTGAYTWSSDGSILLQRSPILQVTSFSSVDVDGGSTDVEGYELREPSSKYPRLVPLGSALAPTGTLKIEYRAGYADLDASPPQDAEVVPVRFKQAIKLWVEANYDRDEKMMSLLLDTAKRVVESEIIYLQFA